MYVLISGPYTCNNNMFYQFKQHIIYNDKKENYSDMQSALIFLSELFESL